MVYQGLLPETKKKHENVIKEQQCSTRKISRNKGQCFLRYRKQTRRALRLSRFTALRDFWAQENRIQEESDRLTDLRI